MAPIRNNDEQSVFIRVGRKRVKATVREGEIMLPKAALPEKRAKPPARGAHKNRSGTTSVKSLNSTNDYSSSAVAMRVIGVLGNNTVASLLSVNKDRPSRWASEGEMPTEENRALLADLDALVGQLLTVFTPGQAVLWLNGQDPFLGACPLDVYRLEGTAPLIEAMKAYEQGAYRRIFDQTCDRRTQGPRQRLDTAASGGVPSGRRWPRI